MSKKFLAVTFVALGAVAAVGAVSALAANGNPPVVPPPFQPASSGQVTVQYTLSLTQGGATKSVELHSWQWGLHNTGATSGSSGAGASRPVFSDLSFTADAGALSPFFMLATAEGGAKFDSATLTVTENGTTILTVKMDRVAFTSYEMAGSSASGAPEAPLDSGSLSFAKIAVFSGGNSANWDLVSGTSGGVPSGGGWNLTSNSPQ